MRAAPSNRALTIVIIVIVIVIGVGFIAATRGNADANHRWLEDETYTKADWKTYYTKVLSMAPNGTQALTDPADTLAKGGMTACWWRAEGMTEDEFVDYLSDESVPNLPSAMWDASGDVLCPELAG